MFLLFFLSLFGYTPEQCSDCSWPYYGTANQRGECVSGVGFQANLETTCYNWCLLWASDVITTVPYVVSSNNSGGCVCQRKASGSTNVEYMERPKKSCLSWGPSDEWINKQKVIATSFKNASSVWKSAYEGSSQYDYKGTGGAFSFGSATGSVLVTNSNGTTTNGSIAINMQPVFSNFNNAFTDVLSQIKKQTDAQANILYDQNKGYFENLQKHASFTDSTNSEVLKRITPLATSSDLRDAFDRLNYAINSRGGSSSSSDPTDLTPVLSSIAAARAANLEATGSVQASVDAMNSNLSSKVDAVADSVSGLGSKLTGMARSIDSGSSARWRLDHDSAALSADALRYSLDSTREGEGGGWSDDSTGLFNSHVSTNQSSLTDITSEFESMKTLLLGNSCTEFPSWSFEIMGKTHDLGSNFNSWPLIFTLMRFLGRFAGAFMGFKLVFWVVTRPEGGQ